MRLQRVPAIRQDHLDLPAVAYIRQSTNDQVRKNTGSTAWQYGMVDEAVNLGWLRQNVVVIDEDQGKSGTEYFHREGFKWMFDEVAAKRIGAVLCTEVSRLSRDSGDWNLFLKVCRATDTLVADGNRVYDLSNYSDRHQLNIAGTMSEAERDLMIIRSRQATLAKAQLGKLMICPPTGFIVGADGKYYKDTDEKVREVITLAFQMFESLSSGSAVVAYFTREEILFPRRKYGRPGEEWLSWVKLTRRRFYDFLKNPVYTGAYVFGRTDVKMRVVNGDHPRVENFRGAVGIDQWPVIRLDNHEGYISWEQFLANQEKLKNNITKRGVRGAPKNGAALLQGKAYCGICGHQLCMQYISPNFYPCYTCPYPERRYSAGLCQSLPARAIDIAVEKAYLQALAPAQLQLTLRTVKEAEQQAQKADSMAQRRLDKARADADLAKRRFMQVDPDNRLVARQLETDWENKLLEFNRLENELVRTPQRKQKSFDISARKKLLEILEDLPAIWRAGTTTQVERKQLLDFLIEKVNLTRIGEDVFIEICWRTGSITRMQVPLLIKRTQRHIVELVRKLAIDHTDQEIVKHLNREGLKSARGRTFNVDLVEYIRYNYFIPIGRSGHSRFSPNAQRGDGRYRAQTAAMMLGASVSAVLQMCKDGTLDGVQEKFHTPWWVRIPPEQLPALREAVIRRRMQRGGKRRLENIGPASEEKKLQPI